MQDGTISLPGHFQETVARRGNAYASDCATRQLLDRIGDKWSVLILLLLGAEPVRFNGLKRRVEGISQKMLSQTLRSLERDGLVGRAVETKMPVSVTYAITPLGRELLDALRMLTDWAELRIGDVAEAQARYDYLNDAPVGP